jgi:hypothetical protein
MRNVHKILVRKPDRKTTEDLGVDGMIILEWLLEKYGGKVWTGFIWFRIGTSGRFL